MFGNDKSSRQTVRHIPHRIQVTRRELELFRRQNPDEGRVRDRAEEIKTTHVELRDFPPDEVVLIYTKLEHLRSVERVVGSSTTIATVLALSVVPKESQFFTLANAVRESKGDIAKELVDRVIEPDYSLVDKSEKTEDKKIVVSDNQGPSVSEILKRFNVPEGIATDAQELYTKGPDVTVFTSLFTHFASKYWTGTEDPVNADAFDF